MKDEENIDNLFQAGAEPFEMEPSKKVWDSLDAHLVKSNADLFQQKFIFYKRLAVVLALLLGSTITYLLFHSINTANQKKENLATNSTVSNQVQIVQQKNTSVTFISSDENKSNANKTELNATHTIATQNISSEIENSDVNNSSGNKSEQQKEKKNFGNTSDKSKPTYSEKSHPVNMKQGQNIHIATANSIDKNNFSENELIKQNLLALHPIFQSAVKTETAYNFSDSIFADSAHDASLPQLGIAHTPFIHRISVQGFYAPEYSDHRVKDNNSEDGEGESDIAKCEHPLYSFSCGAIVGLQLNTHWSLRTGTIFSKMNQSIVASTLYADDDDNGETHYSLMTSTGVVQLPNNNGTIPTWGDSINLKRNSQQSISFVNFPIELKYKLNFSRLSLYGFAGPSFNILAQQKTFVKAENRDLFIVDNVNGLKRMNYTYRLGLGVQYSLFNSVSICAEPFYKGSFTSINRNTPFSSFPFSFGMNVGLSYHF